MISREQEESVDVRINLRISSMKAGAKVDSSGDAVGKRTSCRYVVAQAGIAEHSFTILSLKKLRNDAARVEGESELGRDFGVFLPSRVSSEFQSFLALS